MSSLAYELRSDGLAYALDCGVKVRLQGKSATRVRVSMQRGKVTIPPETGDLGTSKFRDRLKKNAAEHFGEVNGLADELGLIAAAYGDHLEERAKRPGKRTPPKKPSLPARPTG